MRDDSEGFTPSTYTVGMCKSADCADTHRTMIEAGAILLVVVVSLGIYLSSWIASREFSKANNSNSLDVLMQYRETLRQKTVRGERERWDGEMMRQLAYRLDQVEREIALKVAER